MGRFVSVNFLASIILTCVFLTGCGTSKSTNVVPNPVPASLSLCVSPSTSCSSGLNFPLGLGQTQTFTATARSVLNNVENETFSFQSSNPAVLTIAGDGTVCAGTWNSLTSPQVCTPGPIGVAQITATAQGVSSPPVTIYVHQQVTSITVSKAPTQPPTLSNTCLSKGAPSGPENWLYQALAFNGNADITSSVGPFTWQDVEPAGAASSVISRPAMPAGSPLNQQLVRAINPGQALLFASVGGVNSQTVPIETCRVQSVKIGAANSPATSFIVTTGTSTTLNATVTDSQGMPLTAVPLTWNSSNPVSVGVSGNTSTTYASIATTSAPAAGAASVIASCTPPTCNSGIKPSLPIYPQAAISFTVRSATPTSTSPTVYASTTACITTNPTNASCNTTVVGITRASSTSSFAAGSPVALPSSPNSIVFDNTGTNAYLGVNSSNLGQNGLMTFGGTSVSQVTGAPGRVLAISPDKTLAVISDTADTPNQVFICTNCASGSRTISSFLIAGATAAAFSPDSLKAYIVAGSNLYVFSKLDALQKISLGATTNDIAFFPEGAFAYLAGPSPAVTVYRTCDNSQDSGATVTTGATPSRIQALPEGKTMIALEPPFVDLISGTVQSVSGCPATVSNSITPFNLGQGTFIPTQFFISLDGSTAYILGEVQQPILNISAASQSGSNTTYSYAPVSGPPLQLGMKVVITGMGNPADNGSFIVTAIAPGTFTVSNPFGVSAGAQSGTGTGRFKLRFVIEFNIGNQTSSLISLANSAVPLSASLSPAGDLLFVGADDGTVHVIDTSSQSDLQQVSFPFSQTPLCYGPGSPITPVPLTVVTVPAATQNGPNTTYSYNLTSGPALQTGQSIVMGNMKDPGNNGTFVITALGSGTFTVANLSGVTATGQSGTGTVPITCNPDLVAVKP